MAGNSSEMTVAQSKPQDSVSRARELDTAAAAIAPMDSSWTLRACQRLEIGAASQDVC